MTDVEMCKKPGCVLAADHVARGKPHRSYRVSELACPHKAGLSQMGQLGPKFGTLARRLLAVDSGLFVECGVTQ